MEKGKKKKSIAHRYWKQFEDLSYALVKDRYRLQPKLGGEITSRTHDGGYDALIWFSDHSRGANELFRILLEAKLRTNNKTALPMSDFSKTMIIAVNMIADGVYISTNAFFSPHTLKQLDDYSRRTGLEIKTINLKDILSWLEQHPNWTSNDEQRELIEHLHKMADSVEMTEWPTLSEYVPEIYIDKLIGRERKKQRELILHLMNNRHGVVICSGQSGMGKTTFLREVMHAYKTTPHETLTIDLQNYPTSREVFIAFLSSIWGVAFSQVCQMDCNELEDLTKYLGNELFPTKQQQALISLISASQSDYRKNADINDAILVEYISRIFSPILSRIPYFIIIENAHDTTANSLQFLLRVIKHLSENQITFLIEERTDFDCLPALSQLQWQEFFYELRRMKVYLHSVELRPYAYDDSVEFIREIDPACSSEKARVLVKLFGGVPLYLATGMELVKGSIVYDLWTPTSGSSLEYGISAIGYIEQAIERFFNSSDSSVQQLIVLLALFDGQLDTKTLTYFFSQEEINNLKVSVHQSIFIRIYEACASLKHGLYLRCIQNLKFISKTYLFKITNEVNRFVCSKLNDVPTIWRKRLDLAKLTDNTISVKDFWQDYAEYLKFLCEEHLALELLCLVYEWNNQGLITLSESQRYYLLSSLTETKITVGEGHNPEVSAYLNELDASIHLEQLSSGEISLRKASLLQIRCSIALSGGNYQELKQYALNGMSLPQMKKNQLSTFYIFFALALKHLESQEKCLEFLEANKYGMESDIDYQCSLNSNRASKYTGTSPKRALQYFKKIQVLLQSSSRPPSLHNEHNIATMHFMNSDIDTAEELCQNTWLAAYRTNNRVEEGRSLHLMGCICWYRNNLADAVEWFRKSYELFNHITHMTHLWRPVANLASICFERESSYHPDGLRYAQKTIDYLLDSHTSQINNSAKSEKNIPILYIGILAMLHHIWKHDSQSEYIDKVLAEIKQPEFASDFDRVQNDGGLANVLKGSSFWIGNRIMLKV